MPEELVIAIVVLVIIGWIAIRLFEGIMTGLTEAQKSRKRRQEED